MKRFTFTLSVTILVYFLGVGWAIAQSAQVVSSKSGDKSAAELVSDGMASYEHKDYAQSAKLLLEAVAKGANGSDVLYNTACSLALAGYNEKALQFLERAIQAGYRNSIHWSKVAPIFWET